MSEDTQRQEILRLRAALERFYRAFAEDTNPRELTAAVQQAREALAGSPAIHTGCANQPNEGQ